VTEQPLSDDVRSIQAERVEPYGPTDKRRWLASLSDEFLHCRLLLHAWVPPIGYYDTQVNSRPVKEMRLVCDRCGSEKLPRIKVTRRRGNLTAVRDSIGMVYAEGYAAPPGMSVTKDDLWAEWMRRHSNGTR
jgi:hypothetical protein